MAQPKESEDDAADVDEASDLTDAPLAEDQLYIELYEFHRCMESEGSTVHVMKAVYHHGMATLRLRELARLSPPLEMTLHPEYDFQLPRTLSYLEYIVHRHGVASNPFIYERLRLDMLVKRCSAYLAPAGGSGLSYAEMRLSQMLRALDVHIRGFKANGYARAPARLTQCEPVLQSLVWSIHALAWSMAILDPLVWCASLCNRSRLSALHALLPTPQIQVQLLWPFFSEALAYMYSALRSDWEALTDAGCIESYGREEEEDDDDDGDDKDLEQDSANHSSPDAVPLKTTQSQAALFLARLSRAVWELYHNRKEEETERKVKAAYQCVS